jgi:hypothetical protein
MASSTMIDPKLAAQLAAQSSQPSTDPLTLLIQSLSGAASVVDPNLAARQEAITTTQGAVQDYSKEAAFTDAAGLINQILAQQMAASMPSITKAADGAGSSAGSMTALLTQKAATDAATAAAAAGAQQAVDYGNIATQNSSILELLTRADSTSLTALLEALKLQSDIKIANDELALQEATAKAAADAAKTTSTSTSSQQAATIGSVPNASAATGSNGLATAVFLPSSPTVSTDSFFNRDGGVLDNKGAAISVGPSTTDAALLKLLQDGLAPSQTWEGTPVPSDLYSTGLKF